MMTARDVDVPQNGSDVGWVIFTKNRLLSQEVPGDIFAVQCHAFESSLIPTNSPDVYSWTPIRSTFERSFFSALAPRIV